MESTPANLTNPDRCLNCETPLNGSFCGKCGQEVKNLHRPFFRMSAEALGSLLELDGRAYRTLFYLVTKPAYLTQEYFSGRRMRYTPPLRLFIVLSVSFFLFVSLYTSIQSIEVAMNEVGVEGEATPLVAGNAEEVAAGSELEGGSDFEEILDFVDEIEFSFFDEQTNENLRRVMRTQAEANFATISENPMEFARGYLEYITFSMLLMMPILALIQKILYFGTGRYYSEHLVLTLNNHSFLVTTLFATSITGLVAQSAIPIANTLFGILETALYFWLWIYLYLSLKNYFQQGYFITLLKFLTSTILYGFVLGFGALVLSAILFFLF